MGGEDFFWRDIGPGNSDRAQWAANALVVFCEETGLDLEFEQQFRVLRVGRRRAEYGRHGGKGQLQPTRATANFQPIPAISKIRKQVEDSGRQMVLDLNALAEMAVLMAERHWSIRGCLRLAKPNGLPQATALRAQYAEILEKAGRPTDRELA